ncbi:uncharacterized protein [Ptychodera flava]|uniref:uncharacterized protein n=1 Tax=Ptychodera flava TaxID=63121 RepID=UPI00396AABFF
MDAKAVFSIGSEIFDDLDVHYNSLEMVVNHHSLMLTPDEKLFEFRLRSNIPKKGKFTILMFVDENDISELSRESAVAKAMNYVADCLHKMSRQPPKWIIISIPKGREDDIKKSLDPHPHLEIIYQSFDASQVITLLKQSHLLLVPSSSINSINLSLSTIATGTPLLVPQYSPSHKTVMEYLPDVGKDEFVVDMKSGHTILGDKIKNVVLKYSAYFKRASAMRENLEVKVKEVADNMKMMFARLICQSQDIKPVDPSNTTVIRGREDQGNAGADGMSSSGYLNPVSAEESQGGTCESAHGRIAGNRSNEKSTGACNEDHSNHDGNQNHHHKQGRVGVRLHVKGGAPENDKPMCEVENDLFAHASTKSNARHYMNKVTGIHNELHGDDIEEGSLNFVIRCGSSDAADALWNAYSSGRLDRMADKTFLSIPLLDDIGARMLSLETFIDYQEYLQCKQDITERDEAENAPDINTLINEKNIMNCDVDERKVTAITRDQDLIHKQHAKDRLNSIYTDENEVFEATVNTILNRRLSMKKGKRDLVSSESQQMENNKLTAQIDTLKIESAGVREKNDLKRENLQGQLDEVYREMSFIEEQKTLSMEKPTTTLDHLEMNLLFLEDADDLQRKQITDQIDEVCSEVASIEKKYSPEIKRLTEQKEQLTENMSLINKKIAQSEDIDKLITNIVNINKGCPLKDTVRRLSREGEEPGEVCHPRDWQ